MRNLEKVLKSYLMAMTISGNFLGISQANAVYKGPPLSPREKVKLDFQKLTKSLDHLYPGIEIVMKKLNYYAKLDQDFIIIPLGLINSKRTEKDAINDAMEILKKNAPRERNMPVLTIEIRNDIFGFFPCFFKLFKFYPTWMTDEILRMADEEENKNFSINNDGMYFDSNILKELESMPEGMRQQWRAHQLLLGIIYNGIFFVILPSTNGEPLPPQNDQLAHLSGLESLKTMYKYQPWESSPTQNITAAARAAAGAAVNAISAVGKSLFPFSRKHRAKNIQQNGKESSRPFLNFHNAETM
jgi:hypothetical protein